MQTEESLLQTVGSRLQYLREYRPDGATRPSRIKQRTVAEWLGVSRSTVSMIENGHQPPTLHQVYVLAKKFEVELGDILPPLDPSDRLAWEAGLEQRIDENTLELGDDEIEFPEQGLASAIRRELGEP